MGLLARSDHLGNVDSGPEETEVLHDTLRVVLGERIAEFGEHSHVGSLQSEASFKHTDQLVEVTVALVLLDKVGKLLGVYNEVEAADLSKTELFLGNTGLVDLSPYLKVVSICHTQRCW
jgi:hypothetical protein